MKTAEFTNSVNPDDLAHHELPHLELHCLPSSLWNLNIIQLDKTIIKIFADINFVLCFFALKELNIQEEQVTKIDVVLY